MFMSTLGHNLWNVAFFCYNFNKLTYLLQERMETRRVPAERQVKSSTCGDERSQVSERSFAESRLTDKERVFTRRVQDARDSHQLHERVVKQHTVRDVCLLVSLNKRFHAFSKLSHRRHLHNKRVVIHTDSGNFSFHCHFSPMTGTTALKIVTCTLSRKRHAFGLL